MKSRSTILVQMHCLGPECDQRLRLKLYPVKEIRIGSTFRARCPGLLFDHNNDPACDDAVAYRALFAGTAGACP